YFLFACPYLPPALHSFPTRRSSDLAGAGEPVHYVMRGGLALDGGVERQDQLLDFATGRPRDQRVDAKILGSDTLERRERAAEHVIAAAKRRGSLDRPEIGHILDDTEQMRI